MASNGRKANIDTTNLQPWDRQPGEGDERWQAFLIYRDQLDAGEPRRSLRKTAASLDKSLTLVGRWSEKDDWVKRVQAYDREQDAIRQAAQVKELEAMVRRQGVSLSAAAQMLLAPINAFLRKLQAEREANPGADPYADYSLRELFREAKEAAKLLPNLVQAERLVSGLSTQNLGGHDGGPVDVRVQEARRRAQGMSRSELERELVGEQLQPGSPAQN